MYNITEQYQICNNNKIDMSDVIVYYEKLIIFKRNNKQFVP